MMANNLVPQEVLRAPTWYENALLNATTPYSKQTPAANALINATTNAQSSLAYPALQYAKGNKVSYKDIWNALTGNNTADWVDVMKEVLPKAQRKMPENVYVNPKMAGAMGTALNMLLDPTNFVPVGIAGEIKNVRHVSPYTFDKFDLSRIGTGEGHQAFGHGAYFTEADEVVNNYVDAFSKSVSPSIDDLEKYFKPGRIINSYGGRDKVLGFKRFKDKSGYEDWSVTVQEVDKNGNLIDSERPRTHHTQPNNTELKRVLGDEYKPVNVYEATLKKGKDHKFLDFHKVVPQQIRDDVREQYIKLFNPKHPEYLDNVWNTPDLTGKDLYNYLSESLDSDQAASKFLKDIGIDGIEYRSGTLSGIKDSPHKNYVVFDDADITIEKRTPR